MNKFIDYIFNGYDIIKTGDNTYITYDKAIIVTANASNLEFIIGSIAYTIDTSDLGDSFESSINNRLNRVYRYLRMCGEINALNQLSMGKPTAIHCKTIIENNIPIKFDEFGGSYDFYTSDSNESYLMIHLIRDKCEISYRSELIYTVDNENANNFIDEFKDVYKSHIKDYINKLEKRANYIKSFMDSII